MVHSCLVKSCKSMGRIPGINYHKIPVNKDRANAWFAALNRTPGKKFSHLNVVCSRHFKPDDYKEGDKKYRRLKPEAIPSLNLKEPTSKRKLVLFDGSRFTLHDLADGGKKGENKSDTDSGSEQTPISTDTDDGSNIADLERPGVSGLNLEKMKKLTVEGQKAAKASSSSDSIGLIGSPKKRRRVVRSFHTYSRSPRKMDMKNREDLVFLKRKLRNEKLKNIRLSRRISHLNIIINELKRKTLLSTNAVEHLKQTVSGIPLALMRRLMIKTRSKKNVTVPYPDELKTFALTLQFYSRKAYEFVRSTFNHALPAQSVLRSWTKNIDCEPGFTTLSFDVLREKAKDAGGKIVCSLVLDEMHIKKHIEFANNKTWGYTDLGTGTANDDQSECATQAYVLMVVALQSNWKIPIAYFLINSLTGSERASIINEAIIRLDEVGINIISITCDSPTVNYSMLTALGCQVRNIFDITSFFYHPVKNYKIFVQLDACHVLKLFRNNWASLGTFLDPAGNRVNFKYINELHKLQQEEGLRIGNKIRKKHIEWQHQKMKVNIAAQTLSSSVADSLEFLQLDLKHPDFIDSGATIKFIRLVDAAFDLLNSRNIFGRGYKGPIKSENEELWRGKFNEVLEYLSHCTDVKGNPLHLTPKKSPFIGMTVTIKSVMGIYDEYVKSGATDLKYLLTYKFSQDHIELFFCAVRSRNGWNNNPTAFQFSHTYKRLLVKHELKNLKGNVQALDGTSLLHIQLKSKKKVNNPYNNTDISLIRKYNIEEHEDVVPNVQVPLTAFVENAVSYISGYVVKMVLRKIHCPTCLQHIQIEKTHIVDDMNMMLLKRKNRGGLKIPSPTVVAICRATEIRFRRMLLVTNEKMPQESNFLDILVYSVFNEFVYKKNIFPELDNHIFETTVTEESHKSKLIYTISYCYCIIRMHSISQKITENMQGDLIRKKLSKLVLFHNQ